MPLVFAAIAPHPPLLIPAIGKEATEKVAKTKEALEKLEQDLYVSRPETIVIISPHGSFFSDAFTLNVSPEYETDLREFGDLSTRLKFKSDLHLAARVYDAAKKTGLPVATISDKHIDHGSAIPLFYLAAHLPKVNILPLGFSELDFKTHLDFGYLLKEQTMLMNRRVAIIASGDLSHALSSDAPAGFNSAGPEFDQKIQELLSSGNATGLLRMDKNFVSSAAECGLRSFLILLGALRGVKYTYKSYSYEGPFGVGYLVANFVL